MMNEFLNEGIGIMGNREGVLKKTDRRPFLQGLDLEIFLYCLEQKFLTVKQAAKRFFPVVDGVKIRAG